MLAFKAMQYLQTFMFQYSSANISYVLSNVTLLCVCECVCVKETLLFFF